VDVRVQVLSLLVELALLPIAWAGRACRDCQSIALSLLALLVVLLAFAFLKIFFDFLPIP
jgi:hypothetical protein